TLDYLARGGRIGRAAALAGSLLAVKPILTIRDGEVAPVRRVRGSRQALAELARTLQGATRDAPSQRIGIAHAAAPDRVVALGAVVGAHAGPGTLGLFWFDDPLPGDPGP